MFIQQSVYMKPGKHVWDKLIFNPDIRRGFVLSCVTPNTITMSDTNNVSIKAYMYAQPQKATHRFAF